MLSFLADETSEVFRVWFTESPACLLICGGNGEIHAANQAFERWSGYTAYELQRLGWSRLSARDDDFIAGEEVAKDCQLGKRVSFSVRTKLVPKGGRPRTGELSAVRYPLSGEMKWFCFNWNPISGDNTAALDVALKHINEATAMLDTHRQAIQELDKRLAARDKISDAERLWLLSGKQIIKHPRTAWAIVIAVASLIVSANALSILKNIAGIKTSLSDPPPSVELVPQPADGIAMATPHQPLRHSPATLPATLVTPAGNTLVFGDSNGLRNGTAERRPDLGALGRSIGRVRYDRLEDCWLGWPDAGSNAGACYVPAGPSWRADDGKSGTIF